MEACRADATSWARIGEVLGVSKQGAQQRFVPRQTDLEGFTRTPEFSRWTPRARAALQHAVDEAARLGQGFVGTEHLLLGVLAGENVAVVALDALQADNTELRATLIARIGTHAEVPGDGLPFTPLARRALDRCLREALRMGHNYVGTEHILIALADGDGLAAQVLHDAEVDADGIRREVIRLLARYGKS
ncbi:MAG: ATP-dependent Clp protease ATP-binding subunit ClpC [Actinomycetota bacterium]